MPGQVVPVVVFSFTKPGSWHVPPLGGKDALAGEKEDLTSWKKTCLVRLKSGWKHLTPDKTQFFSL